MASTIPCSACGTHNPTQARFCMSCGSALEMPCPSCATSLPAEARFCFSCGTEIVAGATDDDGGVSAQAVTSALADRLREITSGAGERRTITMMFCDAKDSTATAELLDPEAWSAIMRETMDCFVSPVERYGGTVARLLGDAVLAYFGAPVAHEDDPQRALLAGLAIIDCTRDLCARVQAEQGTGFDVRVGINTGLVVVGEMGTDAANEYAALGDAANVAARMEQTAEPGTIRVAESTHRLVAPLFEFDPVGEVVVKGRSEPVRAYTVRAAKGTPGQVRGIEGLSSPLIGRDDELATLVAAADATVAGSGRVVSLMGEAGLGKSRLVAELRAATDTGMRWITAPSHSFEDATPYAPFVSALHEALGVDANLEPAERAAAVITAVTTLMGADAREQALYLCSMLGLPLETDDQKTLEFNAPDVLRQRVFDTVAAVLVALAHDRPLVLELEDMHWADATSIELVHHLLPLVEQAPVLFLLLFRPRRDEASWGVHEEAVRTLAHRHVAVSLAPLSEDQSEQLVAELLRVEGLSPRVRQAILAKSEGNPFFVEEVIRSLLDQGIVVREGDHFVATEEITDIAVPDTLAAVLGTRLDRLEPDARRVVQTAAVLGREFSVETLSALTDAAIDLDGILADLQRREILVEHGHGAEPMLAFKHALTRDTAYDTLLQSVRRDLHRLVGKLIQERHPDRVFALARHFRAADEPVLAVPHLVAAGEQAFGAFSRQEAADLFRQAIELWDDRMEIGHARRAHEGLGDALLYLGDVEGSLAVLDDLLAFSREHDDLVGEISALNKSGFVTVIGTGDTDGAEARLLEAKRLAEQSDQSAGLAEFYVGYCYLNVTRGRLDEAERHLGEAAEVCFTLDSHHRNFGLLHYAESLIYQAKFDEARAAVERARAQAEKDEDFEHLSGAIYARALIDLLCGDVVQACEGAEESLDMAVRVGATGSVVLAAMTAGLARQALGRLDQARAHFETCLGAGPSSGNLGPAAAALASMALMEVWLRGPASSDMDDYIAEALKLGAAPVSQACATLVHTTIGLGLLLRGDIDRAREAIDRAEATPSAFSKLSGPEVYICRSGIELTRGNIEAAERALETGATMLDETGMELYRARFQVASAAVAGARGDHDRLRALVMEAEEESRSRQLRLDTALVQRTGIDLLKAAGADDESARMRQRLGETIADIAGSLSDEQSRRDFLRTNALVA